MQSRVDYVRDIKPLLARRCCACHASLKQESGLRLDTGQAARKGGDGGPAVVPGKSHESRLIAKVTASDPAERMPPASEGDGLDASQVALLRAWIDQGATSPADELPEPDPRDHWSFRPPVKAAVPMIADAARIKNPIDAFLAAESARQGLSPRPTADRAMLLRRVYLALAGLPPTRARKKTARICRYDGGDGNGPRRKIRSPGDGRRVANGHLPAVAAVFCVPGGESVHVGNTSP